MGSGWLNFGDDLLSVAQSALVCKAHGAALIASRGSTARTAVRSARGTDCYFSIGRADGALALAAGGAVGEVLQESGRGPGVVLFGVLEAAFALGLGNGWVVHGVVGGDQFVGCVGEHLLEFTSSGAWHWRSVAAVFLHKIWPFCGTRIRDFYTRRLSRDRSASPHLQIRRQRKSTRRDLRQRGRICTGSCMDSSVASFRQGHHLTLVSGC
jgi:hypothetical protein